MTTKTRLDLIDQTLRNLGVLVEGQSPTAEMRQKVDQLLDAHMESLRTEEIVYVADLGTEGTMAGGEYELALFLALADTLAWRCASSFSLAGDASLKALDIHGRDELRRLTKPARTRRMLRVDPQTRLQNRVGSGNYSRGT